MHVLIFKHMNTLIAIKYKSPLDVPDWAWISIRNQKKIGI